MAEKKEATQSLMANSDSGSSTSESRSPTKVPRPDTRSASFTSSEDIKAPPPKEGNKAQKVIFKAWQYLNLISPYTSSDLMTETDRKRTLSSVDQMELPPSSSSRDRSSSKITKNASNKRLPITLSEHLDPDLSGVQVTISAHGRLSIITPRNNLSDDTFVPMPTLEDTPTEIASPPRTYANREDVPLMNIVILVVGSHGDVQPFVSIGLELKKYGHRVRIATHECFRKFVGDNGLEFYPLAGDPKLLMEYMVRTGGSILPGSLRELYIDVPEKQKMMKEICFSTWGACTEASPGEGNLPFNADVIIANPPSYGGPHCAEALNIPLHMMFTLPWTPTREFGHPFFSFADNSGQTLVSPGSLNAASYYILEGLVWEGLGNMINQFRTSIQLPKLNITKGASTALFRKSLPFTYLWSPSLVPKPHDWGENTDVAGFCLLEGSGMADWTPPQSLADFLAVGDKPIFIGFGSCIIQEPKIVSQKIFDALAKIGRRGIIQDGWAGLGKDMVIPSHIYIVGRAPHTWLFKHCVAACHHGGAGTTATSLLAGLPTIVCPFFGDQPFWGESVHKAGAGPYPVRIGTATVDELADAFAFACQKKAAECAVKMSAAMSLENGPFNAMCCFHEKLDLRDMCCNINPKHVAKVYCRTCDIKLCYKCDKIIHKTRNTHSRIKHFLSLDHGQHYGGFASCVLAGGTSIINETSAGVVSFVTEPITGAQEHGVAGFGAGIGKGFGHLITGPIGGFATFVDEIGSGLVGTANKATGGPAEYLDGIAPYDMNQGSHVKTIGDGILEGSKHLVHGITNGVSDFFVLPVAGVLTGKGPVDKTYKGLTGVGQGVSSLMFRPIGGALRGFASPFIGGVRQMNSSMDGTYRKESYHDTNANEADILLVDEKYRALMSSKQDGGDEEA